MLKVLITGATGFVGSHALEALMQRDDIELVAHAREKSRLLPEFKGETRIGDLRDDTFVANLVCGMDVVIHAATWSSLFKHQQASHELFYRPSINLINRCVMAGVKRFVNISTTSAAVPGNSENANSSGVEHKFWPHLVNLVRIENRLRELADQKLSVINLRLGIFTGRRYSLGLLPILVPRLKTHLVPWVAGGQTTLPLIDGRDIGRAITRAIDADMEHSFESINVIGPEKPTVRVVIDFIHHEFGYPRPHFSVPFWLAYPFAGLMEFINPLVPFDPLVTRSIIHLLEETHTNNDKARELLGYEPKYDWRDTVRLQLNEMNERQIHPMRMAKPVH